MPLEDSRIIALFFERSEQAIEELDKKYGAAVRRTAFNILGSRQDAEECANDTWLGAWNSIPPQKPDPLVSYVCRIARNLAISRLRRETAARRNNGIDLILEELEEVLPSREDVEAEYEAKELAEAINRFLSALEYDDRYIFIRRYWYADAVRDIATEMHTRENRISVRLFRLRKNLKSFLKKEGLIV